MNVPKDVREYVDGLVTVSRFHVRLLLLWLKSVRDYQPPRRATTVCCSGPLLVEIVLFWVVMPPDIARIFMFVAVTQVPKVRSLLSKGLEALSAQEIGQLLSRLGLQSLVSDFLRNCVSNTPLFCCTEKS